jgi:hypothetical protein
MHLLTLRDPAALAGFPQRARALQLYNERALPIDALDLLPRALEQLWIGPLDAPDLAPIAARFPALRSLRLALQGMAPDPLGALAKLDALSDVALTLSDAPMPDLAPLAHIHALELARVLDAPGMARALSPLKALRALKLYMVSPDDEVFARIAALPALEHLTLWCIKPRGADALCGLAGAPALRSLELGNVQALSAAEVAAIAAIPTLTTLSLEISTIADLAQLQPLRGAGRRLVVKLPRGAALDDALLVALAAALPDLVALDMSEAPVHGLTSAGIAALGELTRLEWLNTNELPAAVKHDALGWLADQAALAHLWIGGKALGAKLVDTLKGLSGLRTLHLSKLKVSDGAAKKLAGLKLEALCITGAPLTDKGVIALSQIKTLRTLNLCIDKGQLGDAGLSALAALPALANLSLEIWNDYEVTTLKPLAAMPALERLTLPPAETGMTVSAGDLTQLSGAPALWMLELRHGGFTLDEATASALRGVPHLVYLNGFAQGQGALAGHTLVLDIPSQFLSATASPMRALR